MMMRELVNVLFFVLFQAICGVGSASLEDGVLISYENYIELLDSTTGQVKGKFETDLNYISDLLVINGSSQSVILTEVLDGSKTNLHMAHLGQGYPTFSPIVPNESFSLIKSTTYNWNSRILQISQRNSLNKIDLETFTARVENLEVRNGARSLAVDSCNSILYWSSETAIYRRDQDPDGDSESSFVVLQNMSQPNNLVVSGDHLYWMEKTTRGYSVGRLHLETYKREIVCEHNSKNPRVSVYSMDVDEENQTLYWADWHNSAVWKITFNEQSRDDYKRCNPTVLRDLGTIRPLGVGIIRNSLDVDELKRRCRDIKKPLLPQIQVTTEKISQPEYRNVEEINQCVNYCFDHDIDPLILPVSKPEIVLRSSCSYEKSLGIPICHCQTGFSGSRCQIDPCENLCLNGGRCLRKNNRQECQCSPEFSGDRCEVSEFDAESPYFLYLFIATVVFLSILVVLVILLACENSKFRRKLAATESVRSINNPTIIKKSEKRSRTFSGSDSRSKGGKNAKEDHVYDNNEICGTFSDGKYCNAGGDGNGVVLDLEDCCHMTLCDTPCVEASFARRPRKRTKSRTISVSQLEDVDNDDDAQNLIR